MSATGALGAFVAGSRWEDIPAALRHEGRRALVNFAGCALGAAGDPAVAMLVRALLPLSGSDRVALIGRAERLDVLGASFVNAVAANLLDYDDTHLETVIHPAAPVAAPVFALAEQRGLSGAAALHAFVLGAEVECRIGMAVSPGHYARGWHITSTCGVFGAAAAAARLLGLDAAACAHALGIAASQSAGLVENLPTAAKNVSVGNAARNGVFAALLAAEGCEAAPAAIEGGLGWARAMGDVADLAALTGGLGQHWEFARNTYKPYPCGIVLHAVIDACLALRAEAGLPVDRVASVLVEGDALLLARGDRVVANARDARVSIHHCVASVFVRGAADVAEFAADCVADPAMVAFRGRVTARLDAALPMGAARVTVATTDGAQFTRAVEHARGSLEMPLTDLEIAGKAAALAIGGGRGAGIADVIADIWAIDGLSTLRPLMWRMAGSAGGTVGSGQPG